MLSVKNIFNYVRSLSNEKAAVAKNKAEEVLPVLKKKYNKLSDYFAKEAIEVLLGKRKQPTEAQISRDCGVNKLTYLDECIRKYDGIPYVTCHLPHKPIEDVYISLVSSRAFAKAVYQKLHEAGLRNFCILIEVQSYDWSSYTAKTFNGSLYSLYYYVRMYENSCPEGEILVDYSVEYDDDGRKEHCRSWKLSEVKDISQLTAGDITGSND